MPRISDAVKADHAIIESEFHDLFDTQPEDRNEDKFVWALNRYLMVEDLVVMAALQNHIANGGERQRRLSDDYDSVSYAMPTQGVMKTTDRQ